MELGVDGILWAALQSHIVRVLLMRGCDPSAAIPRAHSILRETGKQFERNIIPQMFETSGWNLLLVVCDNRATFSLKQNKQSSQSPLIDEHQKNQ